MSSSISADKINVLFVCMSNICRSPMAEAIFRDLVDKSNLRDRFEIQSAGVGGVPAGERPHRGTREVLFRHGIDSNGLVAKPVSQDMLDRADYIVAMDNENLSELRSWRIAAGKLSRLLDYATDLDVREVPDPYYDRRFELVYELSRLGAQGLLKHIQQTRP